MTQPSGTEVLDDPQAQIFMRHPLSGPVTTATQEAYDLVWKTRGWKLLSPEEVESADVQAVADEHAELRAAAEAAEAKREQAADAAPAEPTSTAADVASTDTTPAATATPPAASTVKTVPGTTPPAPKP